MDDALLFMRYLDACEEMSERMRRVVPKLTVCFGELAVAVQNTSKAIAGFGAVARTAWIRGDHEPRPDCPECAKPGFSSG